MKPAFRLRGHPLLYAICLHLAIGASLWGYNIGILSSVLVHPGFSKTLRDPPPSIRGIITGVYYVGTLLSYLFLAHPLADWLGRKRAAAIGTVVMVIGMWCMAAARGLLPLVIGRLACGLGVGIISTTVPLYQSEISPAKERGKFVTMNHVGFIAGMAVGLWVGYGMSFWKTTSGDFWGWRFSIFLQIIPATIFLLGLPFLPETPRWLVQQGRKDEAKAILYTLRPSSLATQELDLISTSTTRLPPTFSSFKRLTLSLFRDPALFARLWRAFLLQFMAQMCGAAAMKYYLPSLLQNLGLSVQSSLMAGAIEMTLKIGMTVVEMWIIDRLGRRLCLVLGSVIMGVAMLINGALPLLYPNNMNKSADIICIMFIFIYAMGYSLGLGPAAWVYSSEIFPTSVRARGLNLAASGGALGSIIVSQIWPLGNAAFGSGIYFFFMVVNFACAPTIWFLYPETKGRELEDMDALFGKTDTQRELALGINTDEQVSASPRASGEEQDRLLAD
ncbi:general substrate transporter [Emericellopsis atlantica]|uniref:General substrate transporter n=1 Tax=Emericellopsis atlantica TaxID=2614577 RepID=A0A9P7ZSG0_9HYPO|nr:general substrate transporter [Emericellopsis atlantica]KAG9256850.1 general substrate transporter [Emericellopsis atlantica]